MVFILTKAAIIAAIITVLGLYFSNEMRGGRPHSNFTNPHTPSSNYDSSVSCNCQLITSCLSSLRNNETPRFCGFEGIQRKICCDPVAEGEEGVQNDEDSGGSDSRGKTNAFINTARIQSQAAKFYRNQFLYNNERIRGSGWIDQATSTSKSTATSKTMLTSKSTSMSMATSKSTSVSTATSKSTSVSSSVSKSTSMSKKTSTSMSESTATSKSVSKSSRPRIPTLPTTPKTTRRPTTPSTTLSPDTDPTTPPSDTTTEESFDPETEKPKENRKLSSDQLDEESLKKLQKDAGSFLAEFFPEYYNDLVKNLTQLDNVTFIENIPVPKDKTNDSSNSEGLFGHENLNLNETEIALKRLFELQDEYFGTTPRGGYEDGEGVPFDFEQFLNISGLTMPTSLEPPLNDGESGTSTISTDLVGSDKGNSDPDLENFGDSASDDDVSQTTTIKSDFEPDPLSPSSFTTLSPVPEEKVESEKDSSSQSPTLPTKIGGVDEDDLESGIAAGPDKGHTDLNPESFTTTSSTLVEKSETETDVITTSTQSSISNSIKESLTQSSLENDAKNNDAPVTLPELMITPNPEMALITPDNSEDRQEPELTTLSPLPVITDSPASSEPSIIDTKSESSLGETTSQASNIGEDSGLESHTTQSSTGSFDEQKLDEISSVSITTPSTSSLELSTDGLTSKVSTTTESSTIDVDDILDPVITTTQPSNNLETTNIPENPEIREIPTTTPTSRPISPPTEMDITTMSSIMDESPSSETSEDEFGPTQTSSGVPTGHSLLHQEGDAEEGIVPDDPDHNKVDEAELEDTKKISSTTETVTTTLPSSPSMSPPTITESPSSSSEPSSEIETTTSTTQSEEDVAGKIETNLSDNLQHFTTPPTLTSYQTTISTNKDDLNQPEVTTISSLETPETTKTPDSSSGDSVGNTGESNFNNESENEDMISTTESNTGNNKSSPDSELNDVELLSNEVIKALDEDEATTTRPEVSSTIMTPTTERPSNVEKFNNKISPLSETTTAESAKEPEDDQVTTQSPQTSSPSTRSEEGHQQDMPIIDITTTESSSGGSDTLSESEVKGEITTTTDGQSLSPSTSTMKSIHSDIGDEGHTESEQDENSKSTTTPKYSRSSTPGPITTQMIPNSEQSEDDSQPGTTMEPTFTTMKHRLIIDLEKVSIPESSDPSPIPTTSENTLNNEMGEVETTSISSDTKFSNPPTNLPEGHIDETTQNIESVPETTHSGEMSDQAPTPHSLVKTSTSSMDQNEEEGNVAIATTTTEGSPGESLVTPDSNIKGQDHLEIEDEVTTESAPVTSSPSSDIDTGTERASSIMDAFTTTMATITTKLKSLLNLPDSSESPTTDTNSALDENYGFSTPTPVNPSGSSSKSTDAEKLPTTESSLPNEFEETTPVQGVIGSSISSTTIGPARESTLKSKIDESDVSTTEVTHSVDNISVPTEHPSTETPDLPIVTTPARESPQESVTDSGPDQDKDGKVTTESNSLTNQKDENVAITMMPTEASKSESMTTPDSNIQGHADIIEDEVTTESVPVTSTPSSDSSTERGSSTTSNPEIDPVEVMTTPQSDLDFDTAITTVRPISSSSSTTSASISSDNPGDEPVVVTTEKSHSSKIDDLLKEGLEDANEISEEDKSSGDSPTGESSSSSVPPPTEISVMDPMELHSTTTQEPILEKSGPGESLPLSDTDLIAPTTDRNTISDDDTHVPTTPAFSTTTSKPEVEITTESEKGQGGESEQSLGTEGSVTSPPKESSSDPEVTTFSSDIKSESGDSKNTNIEDTTQSSPITDAFTTTMSTFTTKIMTMLGLPDSSESPTTNPNADLETSTPVDSSASSSSLPSSSRDDVETTTQILETEQSFKTSKSTDAKILPTTQSSSLDELEETTPTQGVIGSSMFSTTTPRTRESASKSELDESDVTTKAPHDDALDPTAHPSTETPDVPIVTSTAQAPPQEFTTESSAHQDNDDKFTTENSLSADHALKPDTSPSPTKEPSAAISETTISPDIGKDQDEVSNAFRTTTTETSFSTDLPKVQIIDSTEVSEPVTTPTSGDKNLATFTSTTETLPTTGREDHVESMTESSNEQNDNDKQTTDNNLIEDLTTVHPLNPEVAFSPKTTEHSVSFSDTTTASKPERGDESGEKHAFTTTEKAESDNELPTMIPKTTTESIKTHKMDIESTTSAMASTDLPIDVSSQDTDGISEPMTTPTSENMNLPTFTSTSTTETIPITARDESAQSTESSTEQDNVEKHTTENIPTVHTLKPEVTFSSTTTEPSTSGSDTTLASGIGGDESDEKHALTTTEKIISDNELHTMNPTMDDLKTTTESIKEPEMSIHSEIESTTRESNDAPNLSEPITTLTSEGISSSSTTETSPITLKDDVESTTEGHTNREDGEKHTTESLSTLSTLKPVSSTSTESSVLETTLGLEKDQMEELTKVITTTETTFSTDAPEMASVDPTETSEPMTTPSSESNNLEPLTSTTATTRTIETSTHSPKDEMDSTTESSTNQDNGEKHTIKPDVTTSSTTTEASTETEIAFTTSEPNSLTVPSTSSESPTFTSTTESIGKSEISSDDKFESTTNRASTDEGVTPEKEITELPDKIEDGNELLATTGSSLVHSDKMSSTTIPTSEHTETGVDSDEINMLTTTQEPKSSMNQRKGKDSDYDENTDARTTTVLPLPSPTEHIPSSTEANTGTEPSLMSTSTESESTTATNDGDNVQIPEPHITTTTETSEGETTVNLNQDLVTTAATNTISTQTPSSPTTLAEGIEMDLDEFTTTEDANRSSSTARNRDESTTTGVQDTISSTDNPEIHSTDSAADMPSSTTSTLGESLGKSEMDSLSTTPASTINDSHQHLPTTTDQLDILNKDSVTTLSPSGESMPIQSDSGTSPISTKILEFSTTEATQSVQEGIEATTPSLGQKDNENLPTTTSRMQFDATTPLTSSIESVSDKIETMTTSKQELETTLLITIMDDTTLDKAGSTTEITQSQLEQSTVANKNEVITSSTESSDSDQTTISGFKTTSTSVKNSYPSLEDSTTLSPKVGNVGESTSGQNNAEEQETSTVLPMTGTVFTTTEEPSQSARSYDDVTLTPQRTTTEVTTSSLQVDEEVPTTRKGASDTTTSSSGGVSPTEPGESLDKGSEDGEVPTTSPRAEQGSDRTTTTPSTIDIDENLVEPPKTTESTQSQIKEQSTISNDIPSSITTTMKSSSDVERTTLKSFEDDAETTLNTLKSGLDSPTTITSPMSQDINSTSEESVTKSTGNGEHFTTTESQQLNPGESSETTTPISLPTTSKCDTSDTIVSATTPSPTEPGGTILSTMDTDDKPTESLQSQVLEKTTISNDIESVTIKSSFDEQTTIKSSNEAETTISALHSPTTIDINSISKESSTTGDGIGITTESQQFNPSESTTPISLPTTSKSGTSDMIASATSPSPTEPEESVEKGTDGEIQTTTSRSEQRSDSTTISSTIDTDEKSSRTTENTQSQDLEKTTISNDLEKTTISNDVESVTMKSSFDEQTTFKSRDGAETTISAFKSGLDNPTTKDINSISKESTQSTGDGTGFTTTESQQFNPSENSESTTLMSVNNASDPTSEVDMKTENIQNFNYSSTPQPTTGRSNQKDLLTTEKVNLSSPESTTISSISVLSPTTLETTTQDETTTGSRPTILNESTTNSVMSSGETVTSTTSSSTMFSEDITSPTTETSPSATNSSITDNETIEKLNEEIIEKLDHVDLGLNMSTSTESSTEKYLETSPTTTSSPNELTTSTLSSLDIDQTTMVTTNRGESDLLTTTMSTLDLATTTENQVSDEVLDNITETVKALPPPFILNITEIFPEPGSTPAEPKTSVTSSKTELKTTSTKSSTFSPIPKNITESTSTPSDENDSTTQISSINMDSSDNKTSESGMNSSTDVPSIPGLNDLEFVPDYPEQFNHNDSSEIDTDSTTPPSNATDSTTKMAKQSDLEMLAGASPTPRKVSDGVSTTPDSVDEYSTTLVPTLTDKPSNGSRTTEISQTTTESPSTTSEYVATTMSATPSPSTNSSDNPRTIVSFIVSVSATRTQSSKSKTFTETHNVTYHHVVSLNHTEDRNEETTTNPTTVRSDESHSTTPIDELVFDESTSTPNPTLDGTTLVFDFVPETTTQGMDESFSSTTTNSLQEISTMRLLLDDDKQNDTLGMTTTDSQLISVSSTPKMDEAHDDELVFDEMTSTTIPNNDTGIVVDVQYENITETTSSTTERPLPNSTFSFVPELEATTSSTTPNLDTTTVSSDIPPENISIPIKSEGFSPSNKTFRNLDLTLPTTTAHTPTETEAATEFSSLPAEEHPTEKGVPEAQTTTDSSPLGLTTTEKVVPSSSLSPVSDVGADFADLFTSHSRSNPNSSLILDIITRPLSSPNATSPPLIPAPTIASPSNKTEQEVSLVISTGRGNRSLTNPEAIYLAKELGSQISNVVNQLLLTTHKKFHLLPLFTECANARIPRKKSRVLNLEYEHLPHVVRIGAMESGGLVFGCAGTLISKRYVLTSAFCLQNKYPITTTLLEDEQSHKRYVDIESIIIHPDFSNQTHDNDIALIRLKEEQPEIKPICLPFEDAYGIWESIQQSPGNSAMLSGWTKKVKKSREVNLSETAVDIIPERNCTSLYSLKSSTDFPSQEGGQGAAYPVASENTCKNLIGGPFDSGKAAGDYTCQIYFGNGYGGESRTMDLCLNGF